MKRNLILTEDLTLAKGFSFKFDKDLGLYVSDFSCKGVMFKLTISNYDVKTILKSILLKKEPKKKKQDIKGFVEWCAYRDWVYFKDKKKWKNYHSQDWKTSNELINLFNTKH